MWNQQVGVKRKVAWGAGVALAVALGGCAKMDQVTVPGFDGPSALTPDLQLTASPDSLLADGHATSVIGILMRDANGQPLAGRQVTLMIQSQDGSIVALGDLSTSTVRTGNDGRAQAIYTAPLRHEQQANQFVFILGRPVSEDAAGQIYRSVQIELVSPEQRQFPGGSDAPTCGLRIDPPGGPFHVLVFYPLQSTSSDASHPIVRYFWDFGDGTDTEDKPDVYHMWIAPGTYTIRHDVTNSLGVTVECTLDITVEE